VSLILGVGFLFIIFPEIDTNFGKSYKFIKNQKNTNEDILESL
jgi:hypothetical protein